MSTILSLLLGDLVVRVEDVAEVGERPVAERNQQQVVALLQVLPLQALR